jgi:hypothetical protein
MWDEGARGAGGQAARGECEMEEPEQQAAKQMDIEGNQ